MSPTFKVLSPPAKADRIDPMGSANPPIIALVYRINLLRSVWKDLLPEDFIAVILSSK
jgi:hypothetical protein